MNTTNTTTGYGIIMVEWFDHRNGAEVMADVLRAIGEGDGCHLYQPEVLAMSPYENGEWQGELELWFSLYCPTLEMWGDYIDRIREAGMRVKEGEYNAPASIARADARVMWEWFYDFDRLGYNDDE